MSKFNYKVSIEGQMADGSAAIMDIKASCEDELDAIIETAFSVPNFTILDTDDPYYYDEYYDDRFADDYDDYDPSDFEIDPYELLSEEEQAAYSCQETYDDEIIERSKVYIQ